MSNINEMVIRTSMRNMFNKGWVDVSAIKECLKLAGIIPTGNTINQLQALHCVNFKDMDRELAELIPGMVASLFDGMQLSADDLFKRPAPAVNQAVFVDVVPQTESRSLLKRLGIG